MYKRLLSIGLDYVSTHLDAADQQTPKALIEVDTLTDEQ